MLKKISLFLAITLFLLLAFSPPVLAEGGGEPRVFLDGEEVEFPVAPRILKGRLLVPVRPLLNALKAEIRWDGLTGSIIIRFGERVIKINAREFYAEVDGERVDVEEKVAIIESNTMVSLRFFAEIMDLKLNWCGEEKKAALESKNYVPFQRLTPLDLVYLSPEIQDWVREHLEERNVALKVKSGHIYLLATFGLKETGGYEVRIKKMERTGDALRVEIEFIEPRPEQYTFLAFTRPYDLARVEASRASWPPYLIFYYRGTADSSLPLRYDLKW